MVETMNSRLKYSIVAAITAILAVFTVMILKGDNLWEIVIYTLLAGILAFFLGHEMHSRNKEVWKMEEESIWNGQKDIYDLIEQDTQENE